MKTTAQTNSPQKGFTLIELLIVIAILGVLATVVLVAINPLEQLAKGRDAGRHSSVSELGQAVQRFVTNSPTGQYPTAGSTWQDALKTSGDIPNVLTVSNNGIAASCYTTDNEGNFCYSLVAGTGGTSQSTFVVWTILESNASYTRPTTPCTGSQVPAAVYSSSQGHEGVECLTTAATVPTAADTLY